MTMLHFTHKVNLLDVIPCHARQFLKLLLEIVHFDWLRGMLLETQAGEMKP